MATLQATAASPWLPVDHGSSDAVAREVASFRVSDVSYPSGLALGPHRHRRDFLSIVLDGTIDEASAEGRLALTPATAVAIPSGLAHADTFHGGGARAIGVEVDGGARHSHVLQPLFSRFRVVRAASLTDLAHRLAGELGRSDPAAPLAAEGLVLELLAVASRRSNDPATPTPPPDWLASVDELLRQGFRAPLRVADLARAVCVHPAHLSRVFRAHNGVSLAAHVRRLRLDWAADQLTRSDSALVTIAAEAGFANQSHFTNAFKRYAGLTPARYRALKRTMEPVPTPFDGGPAIRDDRDRDVIPPVLFWK
jgi:AraC family transcriptional regulator